MVKRSVVLLLGLLAVFFAGSVLAQVGEIPEYFLFHSSDEYLPMLDSALTMDSRFADIYFAARFLPEHPCLSLIISPLKRESPERLVLLFRKENAGETFSFDALATFPWTRGGRWFIQASWEDFEGTGLFKFNPDLSLFQPGIGLGAGSMIIEDLSVWRGECPTETHIIPGSLHNGL